MKKFIGILICFMGLSSALSAQWTQKASLYDYGRTSPMGCSLDGKAYAGLGAFFGSVLARDFWEYDNTTNVWTRKTDYPGAGSEASTSFAINGKIYVCLGADYLSAGKNDLWEYNPANDSWISKSNFPGTPRFGASSFVIGDSAFVVAGSYNNGNDYLYDTYMYTPATDSWKRKADFAGSHRCAGTAFSIGGFGYYGCGLSNSQTPQKDFWKYDPVSDIWSSLPDFPGNERSGAYSFVINNIAYVGFGDDNRSHVYFNDLGVFHPSSNSWTYLTSPPDVTRRSCGFSFTIGSFGYIGTGLNEVGLLTDLWQFKTDTSSGITFNKNNLQNLEIFPVPTSGTVTVQKLNGTIESYTLLLTTMDGREVLTRKIEFFKSYKLDLSGFSNGVYFLSLQSGGKQILRKVILEK